MLHRCLFQVNFCWTHRGLARRRNRSSGRPTSRRPTSKRCSTRPRRCEKRTNSIGPSCSIGKLSNFDQRYARRSSAIRALNFAQLKAEYTPCSLFNTLQDVTVYRNLGALLHIKGRWREAEDNYRLALQLVPDDRTTLTNLKRLHQLLASKAARQQQQQTVSSSTSINKTSEGSSD